MHGYRVRFGAGRSGGDECGILRVGSSEGVASVYLGFRLGVGRRGVLRNAGFSLWSEGRI